MCLVRWMPSSRRAACRVLPNSHCHPCFGVKGRTSVLSLKPASFCDSLRRNSVFDPGVENVVISDEYGIRLLKYLVMIYGPVIMLSDRSAQTPAPPAPASRRVSPALFRRQRLLMRMATYRPLAVLASIWVVLLAIALLAYGQLLRTDPDSREQSTPPQP